MEEQREYRSSEEMIRARRRRQQLRRRREAERKRLRRRRALALGGLLLLLLLLVIGIRALTGHVRAASSRTESKTTSFLTAGQEQGSKVPEDAEGGGQGADPGNSGDSFAGSADGSGFAAAGETSDSDLTSAEDGEATADPLLSGEAASSGQASASAPSAQPDPVPAFSMVSGYQVSRAASVRYPAEEDVQSSYAVLINAADGSIVAAKNERERIYPASMTKVMTLLVAAEAVQDLDDTFTVTLEITDYAYKHQCSTAGFLNDEAVPIRDLFYGTILPSGGEAALALAIYTAGSQEAFVERMNAKAAELGLSASTHFTNCIGLFDEENYTTCADMAMILKAAMENVWCRNVLSRRTCHTQPTEQHPDGIELSNWFLRRIEDKDTAGYVWGAKTGFVKESGNCAASFLLTEDGTPYLCVTGKAHSAWRAIYDHVSLYAKYR